MKWLKHKAVLAGIGIGLFLLVVLLPLGGAIAQQVVIEPAGGPIDADAEITQQIPWTEYYFLGWDALPQTDVRITTMPK